MPRRKAKRILSKVTAGISKPAKPIESFIGFSRLPAEIQQIIWKEALPVGKDSNGRRMLKLECQPQRPKKNPTGSAAPPEWVLVVDKRKRGDFANFHEVLDIGLSRACKNSRDLWLRTFTNELVERKGIVRYNDATTIYIEGLDNLRYRSIPLDGIVEKQLLPASFYNIKRLAIKENELNQQSIRPLSVMLSRFKSLEFLASVAELWWSAGKWEKWGQQPLKMKELKERLRFQRSKVGLDGSLPRIKKWNRYHADGREAPEFKVLADSYSFDGDFWKDYRCLSGGEQ